MGFFNRNKSNKGQFYLALLLLANRGTAIILKHSAQEARIEAVDEKIFGYSNGWDNLVDDIDELLLELEKMNKVTMEQVIFFLPSERVTVERTIKKHYLSSIKKITKELNLKPLGFIEEHEALALSLQQKEDIPLSAIIIEFGEIEAIVFHYQKGQVIGREHITINSDFDSELEAVLTKFKTKSVLPSLILVYGEDTATTLINSLLTHRFDERLFIQIPHVKSVSFEEIKQAFLYSFSQQITGTTISSVQDEKSETVEESPERLPEPLVASEELNASQPDIPVEGFMLNQDVNESEDISSGDKTNSPKNVIPAFLTIPFQFIKMLPTKLATLRSSSKKSTMLILMSAGLACVIAICFAVVFFFHKAVVTVYTPQQELQKDTQLNAVIDTPAEDGQLQIHKTEKETDTDASVNTTGKKTIGEKARGEVTVVNSTSDTKVFKSGTILTSPDGLQFTLDSDVTVASASPSSSDLNIVTGKTKTNITAVKIGPESNIDKDERLKIEDFSQSTYFAQTNNKFSGGTKKDIQTVSKDDITNLEKNAIKKITDNNVDTSSVTTQSILSDLTKVELTDEQFSKELGEEAQQVTLKAKGMTSYFTYNKDDLIKIASPLFKESLPSGFTIGTNDYTFAVSNAQEKDEKIQLSLHATAVAKKRVDKSLLLDELKGKSTNDVSKITHLESQSEVQTFIPFLNHRLPFFKRNIILNIESK
jgi:hypothetical protein